MIVWITFIVACLAFVCGFLTGFVLGMEGERDAKN